MTELMRYCFVEKGACYALGGDLWGKEGGDVFRAVVDVRILQVGEGG